jgi:NAD binding domain of 6-phosphogluconate dehydrogenase
VQAGIAVQKTPAHAIEAADVVLLMLADAAAIHEAVLLGDTRAKLGGKCVLQMGTIGPDESRGVRDAVIEAGGEYLEAPVRNALMLSSLCFLWRHEAVDHVVGEYLEMPVRVSRMRWMHSGLLH